MRGQLSNLERRIAAFFMRKKRLQRMAFKTGVNNSPFDRAPLMITDVASGGGGGAPEWVPATALAQIDVKHGQFWVNGLGTLTADQVFEQNLDWAAFSLASIVDGVGLHDDGSNNASPVLIGSVAAQFLAGFTGVATLNQTATTGTADTTVDWELNELPGYSVENSAVYYMNAAIAGVSTYDVPSGYLPSASLGDVTQGRHKLAATITPNSAFGSFDGGGVQGVTGTGAVPNTLAIAVHAGADLECLTLYAVKDNSALPGLSTPDWVLALRAPSGDLPVIVRDWANGRYWRSDMGVCALADVAVPNPDWADFDLAAAIVPDVGLTTGIFTTPGSGAYNQPGLPPAAFALFDSSGMTISQDCDFPLSSRWVGIVTAECYLAEFPSYNVVMEGIATDDDEFQRIFSYAGIGEGHASNDTARLDVAKRFVCSMNRITGTTLVSADGFGGTPTTFAGDFSTVTDLVTGPYAYDYVTGAPICATITGDAIYDLPKDQSEIDEMSAVETPVCTARAVVTGSAGVGDTMHCAPGSYTNSPTSRTYQWFRQNGAGTGGDISGATSQDYTITDAGYNYYCKEFAHNAAGVGGAISNVVTGT